MWTEHLQALKKLYKDPNLALSSWNIHESDLCNWFGVSFHTLWLEIMWLILYDEMPYTICETEMPNNNKL
jgi:hypothetical protein